MSDVNYQEIQAEEEGQRLDNYLIRILKGVPKSHIYRIIRSGEVRVNKKRAKNNTRLETGDKIRIPPVRVSEEKTVFVGDTLQQQLQQCVLHEDDHLLILNKPAGIAVHGGSGLSLGVIEALRKMRVDLHYLELAHRLDKETSGCLILAKKRSVLRAIQGQLEAREVQKSYWALCAHPWQGKKTVDVTVPLEKNILSSGERFVKAAEHGKSSQTLFTLLENYRQACLVQASPATGRTHQIRVHSAYLGHAIAGDAKYGFIAGEVDAIDKSSKKLYLHAKEIRFTLNGKTHHYQADLDEAFQNTLKQLRRDLTAYEEQL